MLEEQDINKAMEKIKYNKTYNFSLTNRTKAINGLVLYQNDNFTTIINNPVDYVIDGIVYINNQKLKVTVLEKQSSKDKIMNSKLTVFLEKDKRYLNIEFSNFKDLFTHLKETNLFCELSLSKENVVYIGKTINAYEDSIDIDFYNTNFKLIDNAFIKFEDITSVTILSDYADTIGNVVMKLY